VLCAVTAVPLPALASALAWVAAIPSGWLALVARAFAAMPGADAGFWTPGPLLARLAAEGRTFND